MPESLADRIRSVRSDPTRFCDNCRRPIIGNQLGALCPRCYHRRKVYGSVKLTRRPLTKSEYCRLEPMVRKYLKANPPPEDVKHAVLALTSPTNTPPKGMSKINRQHIIWRELAWRAEPEARRAKVYATKSQNGKFWYPRQGFYGAVDLLVHLLCISIITEEQPSRFPHDAAEVVRAGFFLDLWKRMPKGGSRELPLHLTRFIAARIGSSRVGTYLLITARALIRERELEQARLAKLPHRIVWPATVIETLPDGTRRMSDSTGYIFTIAPPPKPEPRPIPRVPLSAIRRIKP